MKIDTEVVRGILFLRFDGIFDNNSLNKFNEEVDYLLYNQGISYYTFDFFNVSTIDEDIFDKIHSKLVEIILSCGRVVMYGLNKKYQKLIGKQKNELVYTNNEKEVFEVLSL